MHLVRCACDRWTTGLKFETGKLSDPLAGDMKRDSVGISAAYRYETPRFASALEYRQEDGNTSGERRAWLMRWLTVGFKYGLRIRELNDAKVAGHWFSSRADLIVGRIDDHWVKEWDAHLELRRRAVKEAKDSRKGVLVGVYRHMGEGAKVGVGYDFTDFSDNLTDLPYRSRGWFLNVLATFCSGDAAGSAPTPRIATKGYRI